MPLVSFMLVLYLKIFTHKSTDTDPGTDDDVVRQHRICDAKSDTQESSCNENSESQIEDVREADKQEHMAMSSHQNFMDGLHDSLAANQNGSLNNRRHLDQEDDFLEFNSFSNRAEEYLEDASNCSAEQSLSCHRKYPSGIFIVKSFFFFKIREQGTS